jgi:hypothetical protein
MMALQKPYRTGMKTHRRLALGSKNEITQRQK